MAMNMARNIRISQANAKKEIKMREQGPRHTLQVIRAPSLEVQDLG